MSCPINVLIVPYNSAPAGSRVPVYVGCPDGAIYPDTIEVEVRYAPGIGYSAYSAVANHGGKLLGNVSVRKCNRVLVGYITMPKGGVTIGAFARPVKVENGVLFEYITVKESSNISSNVVLTANPTRKTVFEGEDFKVELSASAPSDNNKTTAYLVLKTPWGDVYRTEPVSTTFAFGVAATFDVSTINVRPGVYVLTAEAYFDNKLAATAHITVQVLPRKGNPSSIKILPILMAELKRWYKKNVNVPNVREQYDWSFDVTQEVKQVIPDVKKAYLYGWYRILSYRFIGKTKPPRRTANEIVDDWKKGYEMALLHITSKEYPQLAQHPEAVGYYFVEVPAKLIVYGQQQPITPKPIITNKTNLAPLVLGATVLAGIALMSKNKRR